MALLAKMIPDANGVVDCYKFTTYASLDQIIPDRKLQIDFSSVLFQPAPYTGATYERVVMLMTGGFAD